MGRHAKPQDEKLVPLSTNVKPATFEEFRKAAETRDLPMSVLARLAIEAFLRCATAKSPMSQTAA